MKKRYLTIAVLGLITLIAVMTNPTQERHKEVIKNKLNIILQDSMKDGIEKSENDLVFGLGMMFGGAVLDRIVDNLISIDNYVLFSTTKINWDGQSKNIGIGAFGNVFITKKLDEVVKEGLMNK